MILRLMDLPWYEVVYSQIFFRLDLRDLSCLRSLSTEYRVLVDNYLATWDTLDLSSYSCFDSSSFQGLVRACEGLRRVDLSGSYWLGTSHLVELLTLHPELTYLDLTGCCGLNVRTNIFETTNCRNLTSVILRGCNWITSDFLATLLRYNRNLRRLLLADSHEISDQTLASMLEFRTALTELSIKGSTVTDRSLQVIFECCKEIEYLDMRSCPKITDKGMLLLRPLKHLKLLRVSGCISITERGLAPFRTRVEIDVHQSPICRPQLPSLQV